MAEDTRETTITTESIKLIPLQKVKKSINDLRFKKSGFKKCIQCGRCTASCPAAYLHADYKPRDLMRRFMLGDLNSSEIDELIWKCGQCYSCRARCPRNCKAGLGVLALQAEAVSQGDAPSEIINISEKIKKNLYFKGETFLPSTLDIDILNEFGEETYKQCLDNNLKRERLGFKLDDTRQLPIPEDSMREIRKIMRFTGFAEVEE